MNEAKRDSELDTSDQSARLAFSFFNEIGIINQLATTMLAKALPDGVHPSHFSIINHLYRTGDGKTPVRIAAAMQVTKTTMSHSVQVLNERGYVRIEKNPDDARGKLIFLSPLGRQFREDAIVQVTSMFADVLGGEHLQVMERLLDDLTSLRRHLDENR